MYLLWTFPCPSEQFIAREIEGLRRLGVDLSVLVLGPTLPDAHSGATESWVHRIDLGSRPSDWIGALCGFLRRPLQTGRALAAAVRLVGSGDPGSWHRTLRMLLLVPRALEQIAHKEPGVIHAHFATLPATFAMIVAAAIRRPWGFSAHARDIYVGPSDLRPKLTSAAYVVACSRAGLRELESRASARRPRMVCIRHGLDLERWEPRLQGDRSDFLCLLAVGRLLPKKGFDVLLRALAIVRERGLAIRCEVVGSGPEGQRLHARVESCGLSQVVRFFPWLSPEALRSRYAAASALILPSIVAPDGDRDNIPNALVEALALGLPVIASSLPGISEALDGGRVGLLVEPGNPNPLADAIERLVEDPALVASLRSSGRAWCESQFDLAESSRALQTVFQEVARSAGTSMSSR